MTQAPPRSRSGPPTDQPSEASEDETTRPRGNPDRAAHRRPALPGGFDLGDGDGRRRSLAHKLLLATATLLSVVIFVVTAGGYALYRYFDGQIDRVRIAIGGDRPAEAPPGSANFLLVGSDSRSGTGNEFQRTEEVVGERSDTTMLAHLDSDGSTTLVSFPRDTLVRIPGHGRDKLNAAVTIGGPALLVETVEDLTDIKIDHYVSIDLAGFREMTNAIGGVTVCLKPLPDGSDSNLYDVNSQWRGEVGENRLDGDQALAFVRQRIGLPDGDFDRILRQQQFVSAVLDQATSTGVLTNPVKLEALLSAATDALTVDEKTTIDDLRTLAGRLRGLAADQVRFETIPVRVPTLDEGANERGELDPWGSVQVFDPDELDAFFDPLRGRERSDRAPEGGTGHAPTSDGSDAPAVAVDPADVAVDVYNAAGVPGLATQVAGELSTAGFDVGTADNWPNGRRTTTQIRFGPDLEAEAEALAARVPDAELAADRDLDGTVSLVLGSSFDGLAAVTGNGSAAARSPSGAGSGTGSGSGTGAQSTSPTPAPAPTSVTAAELVSGCTY